MMYITGTRECKSQGVLPIAEHDRNKLFEEREHEST